MRFLLPIRAVFRRLKVWLPVWISRAELSISLIARLCVPWGSYDSIGQGHRFQVKLIKVNPGESLSLQMHHYRAEHWIVVTGTALVERDGKEELVSENESVYIQIGQRHRLTNPGSLPLQLIEVQSGCYLGEDDIVRFSDNYNRVREAG